MSMLSVLGHAALGYAQKIGPVFPCEPRAKLPIGYLVPRGYLDASRDPSVIAGWWRRAPEANIGLVCSPASGLCTLDTDPRSGGDDALDDLLEQHGSLPETWTQLTGGGGTHHVFVHPGGRLRGAIGPGVELKAAGYILVAPSVHPSGRQYAWEFSSHPLCTPLAPMPEWMVELARLPDVEDGGGAQDVELDRFALGAALKAVGWLGRKLGPGRWAARCPNEAEHSCGRRFDGSTVLFGPKPGKRRGWLHCSHGHCVGRFG
jgi:hypothetical protein